MIAWLPPTQAPEPGTEVLIRTSDDCLRIAYVREDGDLEDREQNVFGLDETYGWIPAADLLALPVLP